MYRYRFHEADANIFVPVSLDALSTMDDTFHNCFRSQSAAPFPAPDFDGPFNRYAQEQQANQLRRLKMLLGSDYFEQNDNPRIRACHGINVSA